MGEALQQPWVAIGVLAAAAALLRLALGRWLPRSTGDEGRWRPGLDGGLALACGVITAGLAAG